jgi:putative ABC transport system permease protein
MAAFLFFHTRCNKSFPASSFVEPKLPTMFKSYLKIAGRNLLKNKLYSGINIFGLSIGLTCCLAIGLYIYDEFSYDRFHSRNADIYRVVEHQKQVGVEYDIAVTPGLLGPSLKNDFTQVQQACRLGKASGFLQYGEAIAEPEDIYVVDHSFFTMFNFPLVLGDARKVLLDPGEIVITERLATRFFGKNWRHSGNLLGQSFRLNDKETFVLAAIVKDPPSNSHIQFDVLLSFEYEIREHARRLEWQNNNYHTYVLLNPGANAAALSRDLENYLVRFNPKFNIKLSLQPLQSIYLYSDFAFHTEWGKTSNILYTRVFLAVGIIVLLIAIFNFINLSTARAIQRAREVGVRKVIGAFRLQLIMQFLGESLLMTLLSVGLSLLLLLLFIPVLNTISGKSLSIPFNSPGFILSILAFTIAIGITAGIYPAFYLSRFRPVKVLKGIFDAGSGQLFRHTLVVSQFTLSVILIIGAVVIYRQLTFMQNKNLGFDKSQLLYVKMKNELRAKASLLKHDLQQQTGIAAVTASSSNLIDVISSTYGIEWEGQQTDDKFVMSHMNIDPDFVQATGMQLIAGRNFRPGITTDTNTTFLVNETAVRRMGWTPKQALGKRFRLWDHKGTIIGVVKDFHFRPLTETIDPILFYYVPRQSFSCLLVKTKPNQAREAIAAIGKLYKKYESQTALQYEFVDQGLENQYRSEQRTGRIVLYFSVLAIAVSCLGLFGLSIYTIGQRIKEIGIRKVLGASVSSIVALLSKDFLKLVLTAILIASPIAWYAMHRWLEDFAYKIKVGWWVFLLSGSAAVIIALLTISFQSIRAALMSPVKSLRTE